MNKIHKRFIEEADRIRDKYLKSLHNLEQKEDVILSYKDIIEKTLSKIQKYVEINENSEIGEEQIGEDLKDELLDLDINMGKIQKEVKTLNDEIERLKKQSSHLYSSIRKKHPELSDEEIQKEILYSIKK